MKSTTVSPRKPRQKPLIKLMDVISSVPSCEFLYCRTPDMIIPVVMMTAIRAKIKYEQVNYFFSSLFWRLIMSWLLSKLLASSMVGNLLRSSCVVS